MRSPLILVNPARTFVALRLVMAMAICAMSMRSLLHAERNVHVLFAAYLLSNVMPFFRPTSALLSRVPVGILFLLDLGIIVLVMLLTGESRSEFYVVFFLVILMTAIGRDVRSVIAITIVSAILYALLTGTREPHALLSMEFTTRIALFFVTALFSGYLAELVSTERQNHLRFRGLYRRLFEESALGILIAKVDGTVLEANPPARVLLGTEPTGLKLDEILGVRSDLPGPGGAVDSNATFQVELARPEGGGGSCEVTLHRFAAGETSYLLAFLKDLRASNRMRARISELEKSSLMGNLVRSITHEINNPLTAILGHAELIQLENTPASVRESSEAILEAGRRCKRVIESMLGQFQRSSPCRRPLRLSELLRSVAKQMDFHLRYHLVAIHLDLDDSVMVSADAQQLEQVLVNLMCNAVYAMQDRPTRVLGLRSRVAGEHAAVEVSDTGTGIPSDVLKHLFEPGFTTKPAGVGHGLGLMICQDMVQRHGGRLSVASNEGQGTVFTLHLPRIVSETVVPEPEVALRPTTAASEAEGRA